MTENNVSILVVEDEAKIRTALTDFLYPQVGNHSYVISWISRFEWQIL